MFWVQKFIAALILPPAGPLLIALFGLAILRRAPKAGRVLAYGGVGLLLLLSIPVVESVLTRLVSGADVLASTDGRAAQAIVVLAGGMRRDAPEYGGDTVNILSLERARYAATLGRQRRLPVAVAGGAVQGGRPEAEIIAELMGSEFGVPVKWVEVRSRNTHENAVELAGLLGPEGIRRVLLVTHAVDARRGRREMSAAGFDVTAAPTAMPRLAINGVWDFVPSMAALRGSHLAVYEMLGNLKATLDGLP